MRTTTIRHRRRWPAAAAAVAALSVLAGAPALAAEEEPAARIVIRAVDTRDPEQATMTVMVDGASVAPGDFTATENGKAVDVAATPRSTTSQQTGIVLVMDVSESMDEGGALRQAKDAAIAFVAGRLPTDRIAVVAAGETATVVQGLTTDQVRLIDAIEDLGTQPGAAVREGVRKAALLLAGSPHLQANVVVVTDGPDEASVVSDGQARGAAIDADAAVLTVGLQTGELDTGPYERMAADTGGRVTVTSDPTTLSDRLGAVQDALQGQYVLTFRSAVEDGPLDLTVEAAGATGAAQAMAGAAMEGSAVQPRPVDPPGDGNFFSSELAKLVGGALGLAAVALFAYGVGTLFVGGPGTLDSQLQPYVEGYVPDDEEGGATRLAESKLIQRAVELTGQFAEKRGFLAKTEVALERSQLPLRAAEALFFWFATVVVVGVLLGLATGSLVGVAFGVALATVVPPQFVRFKASRRRKKFMALLPDTLQLLSSTLRAGYSLMQGVEAVSREVGEPMGHELRRVCTEARLGRPLEQALTDCADRMGSPDFAWAVMAIGIQREVGGNLSELLMTVAETMTQRERLRREVAALTAEGRMSAMVLGCLPIGLGVIMWTMNPDYMGLLIEEPIGNVMLGGSTLLAGFGFWWMKKTIQVDI